MLAKTKFQSLREEFAIKFKNGEVFKTHSLGYVWVDWDVPNYSTPRYFAMLSTKLSSQLKWTGTNRRVSLDAPEVQYAEVALGA